MQAQWEERLAAYVRTSFDAGVLGALGQNLIQFVSKSTTALILFIGAEAVIEGAMTVGELIAFNMIASQVVQPILRLSQLWQDFQQVQVSVARLGDILNAAARAGAAESAHPAAAARRDRAARRDAALPPRGAGRVAQRLAGDRAGRGDRHRRRFGLGQVDADQSRSSASTARRPAR